MAAQVFKAIGGGLLSARLVVIVEFLPVCHGASTLPASSSWHFERDPIPCALETDWPVGAAGSKLDRHAGPEQCLAEVAGSGACLPRCGARPNSVCVRD